MLAFFKKPSAFSFKLLHCSISEMRGDLGWKSKEKEGKIPSFFQSENMLSGSGSSWKKKALGEQSYHNWYPCKRDLLC